MRIVAIALLVGTALASAGCNYSEQKRQTEAYESFLKETLGTVQPETARQHVRAGAMTTTHLD